MAELMRLKIQRLHPDAVIPKYQSAGAACFDLHAVLNGPGACVSVNPGTPAVIDTGLSFEIPQGWVMEVYSRSGHGFNHDIRLANCVGIIDSDYRGSLKVKLTNDNTNGQFINVFHGDRIAQAKLVPAPQWTLIEVDELSSTERGTGGFGSTGQS